MTTKTYLAELRQKLNVTQQELAALFKTKRSTLSQMISGRRSISSSVLKTLDLIEPINQKKAVQTVAKSQTLDSQTKKDLKWRIDAIRIALHHAQRDLEKMHSDFQKETEAVTHLKLLQSKIDSNASESMHVHAWIEEQLVYKGKKLKKCSLSKQQLLVGRIAALERELEHFRGLL